MYRRQRGSRQAGRLYSGGREGAGRKAGRFYAGGREGSRQAGMHALRKRRRGSRQAGRLYQGGREPAQVDRHQLVGRQAADS